MKIIRKIYNQLKKEYKFISATKLVIRPYKKFAAAYDPIENAIRFSSNKLDGFGFEHLNIFPFSSKEERITKILLHEIRHVFQHTTGKYNLLNDEINKMTQEVFKYGKEGEYSSLPWEKDANRFAINEWRIKWLNQNK